MITIDDEQEYNKGISLKYVINGNKKSEYMLSGPDLNNDGMLNIGDDYVFFVNKKDFVTDEYGTEYKIVSYFAEIDAPETNDAPVTEDDITYSVNREDYIDITYEDGVPVEKIYQFRYGATDPYTNKLKEVFSDYVTVTPSAIENAAKDNKVMTYADDNIMSGAETGYRIYDIQGRMVMRGTDRALT